MTKTDKSSAGLKCSNCLLERAEIVVLGPGGRCPRCGTVYPPSQVCAAPLVKAAADKRGRKTASERRRLLGAKLVEEMLAADLVAVSAVLHTRPDYKIFYDRWGDQLEGWPGVLMYCVKLARSFHRVHQHAAGDDDYEWIESVEDYVSAVLKRACGKYGYLPEDKDLRLIAIDATR